jgi:hypothetical protein
MDIAPENRQITGRGADGRFRKGLSGNPGGRPKGFVGRIKAATGGEEYPKLVKGLAVIAFGTAKQREKFFGEPVTVSTRDRLAAMVELRDSGPGRPVQTVGVGDGSPDVPAFIFPPGTTGVHVAEPGLSAFPAPKPPRDDH